ncbi:ParB/RepB/Spo0J family partition protein [Kitasatospora sp. NBC_01302]|uniref:ParB/RepB/Spo0J family partition protein n=1 Tax=Kitasatospora sp. NBC_01302 TaxID=2903575 RepID=UPI002E0D9C77|nr:ParB/RepB/Spo0J family partition protein [Kitasatospora sp. NBC_01302]
MTTHRTVQQPYEQDTPYRLWRHRDHQVHRVPLDRLHTDDSPRASGEVAAHVLALAGAGTPLPPVLVHRATMRVIDGVHRVRAAELRGQAVVEVLFFDGTAEDAFVLAVEANIGHGLPLRGADRRAAAGRILLSHPQWSDRAIAARTGLAAKTVAVLRRRVRTGQTGYEVPARPESVPVRLGRDGVVRPLNTAEGRRQAARLLAANPRASLREVARQARISPGTVRDVRRRTDRGEDPVPPRLRPVERRGPVVQDLGDEGVVVAFDPGADQALERLVRNLCQDPALRLTEAGRLLLRMLDLQLGGARRRQELVRTVPSHRAATVAEAARLSARSWQELADRLAERADDADGAA